MIDETIPGPVEVVELRYIEKLVSELPPNSHMVEVGTFLGRTAFVMAATRPDCILTVVDTFDCNLPAWLDGATMRGDRTKVHHNDQLRQFRKFMSGQFVITLMMRSPLSRELGIKSKLVFIDASHDYDSIKADLDYWSRQVDRPQALCGHDYCEEFDDVRRAVNEYARSISAKVHVEPGTTVWKIV